MKSAPVSKILAILAVFAVASFLQAQVKFEVKLENKSGWRIDKIYFAPFDRAEWGANLMDDDDVLELNETAKLVVQKKVASPKWDIKCVDVQGVEHIFEDVDLSKGSKVTLRSAPGKAPFVEIQ